MIRIIKNPEIFHFLNQLYQMVLYYSNQVNFSYFVHDDNTWLPQGFKFWMNSITNAFISLFFLKIIFSIKQNLCHSASS